MKHLAPIFQKCANDFRDMSQHENEGLFNQCSWLHETYAAITAEQPDIKPLRIKSALLKSCGIESGKSASSMRDRFAVGTVFAGNYAQDCDYSLHVVCARAAGVNEDDPATHKIAENWLQRALAGYVENGVKRKHTTRTLKAVMRDEGKQEAQTPAKVVLCKNISARVVIKSHDYKALTTELSVVISSEGIDNIAIYTPCEVLLTMFVPANEATESEEAA